MRDLDAGEVLNCGDHARRPIVEVGRVDLHLGALVDHIGVARDGEHGEPLVGRIHAHEDDRVGAVILFAVAAVGAEKQHVIGVARRGRLGEHGAEVFGDDGLVLEPLVE